MNKNNQPFSVWPLMIDMLTSILIIFVLFNFFDNLLNPQKLEQVVVDIKRSAFVKKFDQRFEDEIRYDQISRTPKFDYLQITFSDQILFERGQSKIRSEGRSVLAKLSPMMKGEEVDRDIARIQIEGHTDTTRVRERTSYPRTNWELSSARAIAVLEFLSSLDVPSTLFSANGYSSNVPVSTNLEENRRIEIKIFFSTE